MYASGFTGSQRDVMKNWKSDKPSRFQNLGDEYSLFSFIKIKILSKRSQAQVNIY